MPSIDDYAFILVAAAATCIIVAICEIIGTYLSNRKSKRIIEELNK